MPTELKGGYDAKGLRMALVASRFNDFIVNKLVEGAVDALVRHGSDPAEITIAWVPGALEIAPVARKLAAANRFDAVICLGCVIRGGTDHYTYVANEVSRGVADAAAEGPIPVIFGVLTVDSIEQAIERAGTKMGNKGADAALAAVEMVNLVVNLVKHLE